MEVNINYMEFFLVDVKSTINVNGKDVAFDYINTYLDFDSAMSEVRALTENDDVAPVSIISFSMAYFNISSFLTSI